MTSVSKSQDKKSSSGALKHDTSYFVKCAGGGAISCAATHTIVLPLDSLKIGMQVNPEKYRGFIQGAKVFAAEETLGSMYRGFGATVVGYGLQGLAKFGGYELLKDYYASLVGEEVATKYKGFVWLAASASAEFVADIFLTPWEMIKVKQQQSTKFPSDFFDAVSEMNANRAKHSWPFGSLSVVLSRQIPYTMAKFFFFELFVSMFYRHLFTKDRSEYGKGTQLGVTIMSGYAAGVACAIVSQVPDSLVSLRGKDMHQGKSFGQITKEVGVKKLFTSGLQTRMLMIGTLTSMQWFVYDFYKSMMGLGTSGGY
jgi:solute carrier family 25 (mitochondrial phosphate transporter), member 3